MESKPKVNNKYANFDPKKIIGQVFDDYTFRVTGKDIILYALSIGFNLADPLNKNHFKFTYENDENFQMFPSYVHALSLKEWDKFAKHKDFPPINLNAVLHGED